MILISIQVISVIIAYTGLILLGGKCMIVDEKGPDVFGNISKVIAPHGCCNGYEPNYKKLDERVNND